MEGEKGMKKIAVVTATRAEFGLLKPLIQKLRKVNHFFITISKNN